MQKMSHLGIEYWNSSIPVGSSKQKSFCEFESSLKVCIVLVSVTTNSYFSGNNNDYCFNHCPRLRLFLVHYESVCMARFGTGKHQVTVFILLHLFCSLCWIVMHL